MQVRLVFWGDVFNLDNLYVIKILFIYFGFDICLLIHETEEMAIEEINKPWSLFKKPQLCNIESSQILLKQTYSSSGTFIMKLALIYECPTEKTLL